jgi:hypothetical protein
MAFRDLSRALDETIAATGVRAAMPQDVARRLKISRNLTWKVSKLVSGTDPYSALQHLPGEEGIEILLRASAAAGVSGVMLEQVRQAQRALMEVIGLHAGDRATFDLMLDGMGGANSGERLDASRKLAFRGNSGIWGIQARARMNTFFLAPSATNPDMLEYMLVSGLLDLRRLRANVSWPLFRPRYFSTDGLPWTRGPSTGERGGEKSGETGSEQGSTRANEKSGRTAIETDLNRGFQILPEFCTPDEPPIAIHHDQSGMVCMLEEGPIGNGGATTCYFGELIRNAAPRFAVEGSRFAELFAQIMLPVETLQIDLIVHKSFEWGLQPRVEMRGRIEIEGFQTPPIIPIADQPHRLAGRPPVLQTPLTDRYDEIISSVMGRAGWDLRDFNAVRLVVPYPPMHTMTVLRCPLPERPASA